MQNKHSVTLSLLRRNAEAVVSSPSPSKMLNKDARSPNSKGGFGANTAGQMQSNADAYASLYSALSIENLPSLLGNSSNGGGGVSPYPYSDSGTEYDSCVIQKHQDMVNRHSMCLSRLAETSKEVESLMQENGQLRALIMELQNQLNLVIQASLENRFGGGGGSSGQKQTMPFDILHGFRGLNIGDGKSISVRSNGYLKMAQSTAVTPSDSVGSRMGFVYSDTQMMDLLRPSLEEPPLIIQNEQAEVAHGTTTMGLMIDGGVMIACDGRSTNIQGVSGSTNRSGQMPAFGATSTFAFDPQEAEARCLLEFMTKLKDAGLSNICSESDCKIVVHDPQEAEAILDLEVIKWMKDEGLSNTFSESDTGFKEGLRGQPWNYSLVSCPVYAEEDGGTSGQTAKLESISAMPAYKYKRFESCFAIAGADYCVIAADYTHYHHTRISQVRTEKSVMVSSGLQAHVNALQEALSNLVDKHQHNKPMSCPKIDRLLSDVLFSKSLYHSYTVLVGFDSEGKGRVFTHTNGAAMYERAEYISQEEFIIPPIFEYKLPDEDVLTRLSETEAVNLAKTIFASTTCTGDKLEIVVLNASGLRREYMDLRKKD